MKYRMFSMTALAVALFVSSPAWGAKDARESTHDGKFVRLIGNKLEMITSKGKEHTHTLASNAKMTCDGKDCKSTDLMAGMKIRVTTMSDDKNTVTHIEAIDKQPLFANTHDGKFVSIAGHKLTMTSSQGKEHSHRLTADATMTCDGNVCKAENIKPGMKIRVTTKRDDSSVATHVEALDKDADFGLSS